MGGAAANPGRTGCPSGTECGTGAPVASRGPDHQKEFEISLKIQDKEYSRAVGKSKKIAQQEAAKKALEVLKGK